MSVTTLLKKSYQLSLTGLSPVDNAVLSMAKSASIEERGAIFTRREVVDFILDLVGYTTDKPLYRLKLLEPSVGEGDFLIPAVRRLMHSWRNNSNAQLNPEEYLSGAILAIELHEETYRKTQAKLVALLIEEGLSGEQSDAIVDSWLVQGDFLLTDISSNFQFVVGNPPYVRQELIPSPLINEYRARYQTIYDRADLYVPFIERSLTLLSTDGHLGFICADRWMKNRYGGPLRKFVSDHYQLKFYVDMVNTPAFNNDVSAYPAITVFSKVKNGVTKIVHQPKIDAFELSQLAGRLTSNFSSANALEIKEAQGVALGSEPWILESMDQLSIVRKLESKFPLIEEAGCKVGIGVATGLDKLFIGKFDNLDVEPERNLPIVMTRDIQGNCVSWRGQGVINPFNKDGSLVDLNDYPRLKKYLNEHKNLISKRHVASKNPNNWYRTIDRIYPELAKQPKLLIPDIKGQAHVVFEDGKLYPHHNLYYITSNTWDLRALQAVLRSGIARLFVSIYSTKIRGGYLRFQAQYLRRIRIPHWNDVPDAIKQELQVANETDDILACNVAVFNLYGLSKAEQEAIGGNGT